MNNTETTSFRAWLQGELKAYDTRPKPIHIDGKSAAYTRAIVSAFNTANQATFSVITYGKGLLVGYRSDCRNYSPEAVQQVVQPDYTLLSASELLALAVERFRAEGLGGLEMRAALNDLLTDNDDLL
jgi:hypothetical protein